MIQYCVTCVIVHQCPASDVDRWQHRQLLSIQEPLAVGRQRAEAFGSWGVLTFSPGMEITTLAATEWNIRQPVRQPTTQEDDMAGIKAVAFDLDGLMVNTETLYRITSAKLLQRRGHEPNDELFLKMMGHTNAQALQIMIDECTLDATVAELLNETNQIMDVLLERELKPNPGLFELVDELSERRLPLGVVTNSLRLYAENILGRLAVTDRFEWIISGQEVERGKPDPAVYRLAADRFGVPPAQMLVLEDSEHGCVAAVAAGATVVVVPNEHNRDAEFPGAHLRADDLKDRRIAALLD